MNPRPRMQQQREEKYQSAPGDRYCPTLLEIVIRQNFYSQDKERGTVRDIVFQDLTVTSTAPPPSSFRGLDAEHGVAGVTIQNWRWNGQPVRNAADARLTLGPHVKDVLFRETAPAAKP